MPNAKQSHAFTNHPLFPVILSAAPFLAYIWASPLRDLYGLETRNGLFAKVMLTDGPGLIPAIMGKPYPDYPPLYFWFSWLFSLPAGQVSTFSAVLPSALAAGAMVGLTFLLGKHTSFRTGLIAALVLAACPDYWLKAERATIDMLLALWVSLAVFFLYCRHNGHQKTQGNLPETAAFLMMFLAFLTKGPVGLVLPMGIWSTFLLVEKKWRQLLYFSLKSLVLAACSIGVELLFLRQAGDSVLVKNVFEMQFAARVGQKANEPVFYYILYLLRGAAPWWILACFGLAPGYRKDAAGNKLKDLASDFFSRQTMRLAACWFFFVLVLFSAASTRHSRYLLPLFPALFLMIGGGIELAFEKRIFHLKRNSTSFLKYLFFLITAVATAVYVAAPLSYRPPLLYWLIWFSLTISAFILIHRKAGQNFLFLSLALLCIVSAMTAEGMLVEPWISHQESGRQFVRETEAKVENNIPIVFYKIDSDGDGIKYALYSHRRSESLSFTESPTGLAGIALPFVLVAFENAKNELSFLDHGKTAKELSQGLLHNSRIRSWLIEDSGPGRHENQTTDNFSLPRE
ncbi:MAG: glycosyltransferase family 39 protein [Deltaproteobacteria bacterium]|nr:glycosyltransferase family 39 protein [Deltaproteobacteria bacterium]